MLGQIGQEHLVIEAIVGWRAWRIDDLGVIRSPDRGTPWHDGRLAWDGECCCGSDQHATDHEQFAQQLLHMSARAHQRRTQRELTEMASFARAAAACHCGINAFATRSQLMRSNYRRHELVGEVELTGGVREFELGWRGEMASIRRVWATPGALSVGPARRHAMRRVERVCEANGIELVGQLPWFDRSRWSR